MKEEPKGAIEKQHAHKHTLTGHSPFSHRLRCSSAHVSLSSGESAHQSDDGTPKRPNDRDNLEQEESRMTGVLQEKNMCDSRKLQGLWRFSRDQWWGHWSVTYLENVLLTRGFRLKCVKHFPVTFSWYYCNVFKKTTQQNKPMNVSRNKNMTSRILYSIWPHKPYKGQQTLWEKRDIRKSQTCMENLSFEIFLSSYIFPHSLQNKGHRSITRVIHCLYLMF